jgi:hypothetical protein
LMQSYSSLVSFVVPAESDAATSLGLGASLKRNGQLQVGGGTSIFRNVSSISASCPSYLGMEAVYENVYLVTYANQASSSTLKVQRFPHDPLRALGPVTLFIAFVCFL